MVVPLAMAISWLPVMTVVQSPPLIQTSSPNLHSVHFISIPFVMLLVPLLLGSLIATTVLGIAAIKDIRYSQGGIVGLPLAVADALFLPLLLLNVLIFALLNTVFRSPLPFDAWHTGPTMAYAPVNFLILGLGLCLMVDYLVVRAT
jgi:hypothetical protein